MIVSTRVERRHKVAAEAIVRANGLTLSDVMRCLLIQIIRQRGVPFDLEPPGDEDIARQIAYLESRGRKYDPERDELTISLPGR